ncbi:C40 family peptidase [Sporosarcina luteola]|uniref:C40 family peptidase n=1 Tax=Sporosarcina luteola TaxID=582850 RepID=UPI00203D3389|nr:NlpC/P60 family protein [Sporosarcina luteola]MCM3709691.1 NlpC/P60 family protein [Sporosarcina luteola]
MKRKLLSAALITCVSVSSLAIPSYDQSQTVSAATITSQTSQQAVAAKAEQLIQTAKSLIGKSTYSTAVYKPTYPYKFSCATFLMYIFEKNGVDLATYNEDYMMQQGTPVAKGQWKKGDLLFFSSKASKIPDHVAMYIGDNKVIHMADPKQNIVISDLSSKPYYTESYIGARRVLPSLMSSNPATKGDNIVDLAYDLKDEATIGSVNNEGTKKFTSTGFVNYVYKNNGVTLNASSIKALQSKGTTVSRSNLKKGDLVFFGSSKGSTTPVLVAIYAGDHRLIIPTTGAVITRVQLVDYYNDRYITAKRVFTDNTASTPSVSKPTPSIPPVSKPSTTTTTSADKLVNFAKSLTNKAKFGYGYNESTLTFTGAGFTYYVYKQQGIDLKSKLASQQSQVGAAVLKSNLQKGDLLFFSLDNKRTRINQTGIYIGGNQFISLSTTGKVETQNLSSTWATQNFVKAARVLSN